jgi:hypothetical protein
MQTAKDNTGIEEIPPDLQQKCCLIHANTDKNGGIYRSQWICPKSVGDPTMAGKIDSSSRRCVFFFCKEGTMDSGYIRWKSYRRTTKPLDGSRAR